MFPKCTEHYESRYASVAQLSNNSESDRNVYTHTTLNMYTVDNKGYAHLHFSTYSAFLCQSSSSSLIGHRFGILVVYEDPSSGESGIVFSLRVNDWLSSILLAQHERKRLVSSVGARPTMLVSG